MKISIISFTRNAGILSEKLSQELDWEVSLFTKCSFYKENDAYSLTYVEENIREWAGKQMAEGTGILFIGAMGIAVRTIAPWVGDKLSDSPILVMDELGTYIIPALSGHVGGANEMAEKIAKKTGAIPVITTATDLNHTFAVDLFAKRNHLHIANKEGIAKVSSKVLAGKEVTVSVENGHMEEGTKVPEGIKIVPYPPVESVDVLVSAKEEKKEAKLFLKPKEYVIGMGCKKGKETEKIYAFVCETLKSLGLCEEQIFALASIDVKKEEPGFLLYSRKTRIPFLTFSAEELQSVEGEFESSSFVQSQVGVDNVCERAALLGAGKAGKLIYKKHAKDGMTIAVARKEWRVSWNES